MLMLFPQVIILWSLMASQQLGGKTEIVNLESVRHYNTEFTRSSSLEWTDVFRGVQLWNCL